jgi:hypothetical protein
MSELKELSWSVPETVRPVPFEQLERRGVRRRRRRQVAAGAGVAAVARSSYWRWCFRWETGRTR